MARIKNKKKAAPVCRTIAFKRPPRDKKVVSRTAVHTRDGKIRYKVKYKYGPKKPQLPKDEWVTVERCATSSLARKAENRWKKLKSKMCRAKVTRGKVRKGMFVDCKT